MSLFGGPQVGVEKLEDILDHQTPEFPVVSANASAQFRLQPDMAKLNIGFYRDVTEGSVIVVANSKEDIDGGIPAARAIRRAGELLAQVEPGKT